MKKIFAVLIVGAILFNAGFGVFLGPLLYTLTPLQRHYLGAYLVSSWEAKNSTATTQVRWVWKIKPEAEAQPKRGAKKGQPKFQYALATEDDLVSIPAKDLLWKGDRLPFLMSRKAELDGWSAVVWLVPVQVNSAQLAGWLRHDFFEGDPAWRFFVQPVAALFLALLLGWILVRERDAWYEQNWWRTPVPFWRRLRLGFALPSGRQTKERRETLMLPAAKPVRFIEAARSEAVPPEPKPAPPKQASEPVRQPAPVASKTAAPVNQPALWDESKGLE